jgi:hypothetical protein
MSGVGTFETSTDVRYRPLSGVIQTLSGHRPRAEFDPSETLRTFNDHTGHRTERSQLEKALIVSCRG